MLTAPTCIGDLVKLKFKKRRLVSAYLKLTLWGISLFMVCHSTCVSSAGDQCENVFFVLEGFREDLRGPIIPLGCELADRMGCNKLDEVTVCDYSEYLVLLISLSAGFARERYAGGAAYAVLLLACMLYRMGWIHTRKTTLCSKKGSVVQGS